MSTAKQLDKGETENKHDIGNPPGKEMHGEHDLDFGSVAPAKHPPHGEPGHPGSAWTFEKYRD